MKTKTIKLYSFDELSKEAKQKAIENLSDINVDYEYWDCAYDDFKTMAAIFGIDVDLKKTYFSGFSHQGSGSSYTADVDVQKLVKCVKGELWTEHAPKESLNFYKVTPNIERICKLIAGNFIDGHCSVSPSNRESSIKVDFDYHFEYSEDGKCTNQTNVLRELDNLGDLVEDVCSTLNHWLYTNLEREYEYLTSEEAIIESIQANEYTFTKDGKLENL